MLMKKFWVLAICGGLFFLAVLTGCGRPEESPTIEGLVFSLEDSRFLVVEGISDAGMPYEEWFNKGYNAIFFDVTGKTRFEQGGRKAAFADMAVGQKVQVWAEGGLRKSYPLQGEARRVVLGAAP
jgi:hypothetical protein